MSLAVLRQRLGAIPDPSAAGGGSRSIGMNVHIVTGGDETHIRELSPLVSLTDIVNAASAAGFRLFRKAGQPGYIAQPVTPSASNVANQMSDDDESDTDDPPSSTSPKPMPSWRRRSVRKMLICTLLLLAFLSLYYWIAPDNFQAWIVEPSTALVKQILGLFVRSEQTKGPDVGNSTNKAPV